MPKHIRLIVFACSFFLFGLMVLNLNSTHAEDFEPASCPAPSWKGEFFTNATLTGTATKTVCRRILFFDWGNGAPFQEIGTDNWSTRWTTKQAFSYPGTYQFRVIAANGVRVLIDGQPLIDSMENSPSRVFTADYNVDCAGKVVSITVEFAAFTGDARLSLEYALKTGGSTGAAADQMLGTDMAGGNLWRVEHFQNPGLIGEPKAVDTAPADGISYNYRLDPASAGFGPDQWSSRWTRMVDFPAGTYTFSMRADDSATLFIDDVALMTQDNLAGGQTFTITKDLTAGRHKLVFQHADFGEQASVFLTWDPPVGTMLYPDSCNAIETANLNGGGGLCPDRGPAAVTGGQCVPLTGAAIGAVTVTPFTGPMMTSPIAPGTSSSSSATASTGSAIMAAGANTTTNSIGISNTAPAVSLPVSVQLGPLYFRPTPSRNAGNIMMLHEGESYVAIGRSTDNIWIQLEVGELVGWSMAEYLSLSGDISMLPITDGTTGTTTGQSTTATTNTATTTTISPNTNMVTVFNADGTTSQVPQSEVIPEDLPSVLARATGNMKLRTGPGTNFERIGGVEWGSIVTVIGRSQDGKWLELVANNVKGWSSIDWFEVTSGELSSLPITD